MGVVVMMNVDCDNISGIFKAQQHSWPNTLSFQSSVPSLDFTIALWIVRRFPNMCHAGNPDIFLEILGYKLRSVIRDDLIIYVFGGDKPKQF